MGKLGRHVISSQSPGSPGLVYVTAHVPLLYVKAVLSVINYSCLLNINQNVQQLQLSETEEEEMLPGGIPSVCVTVGQLVKPGSAMQEGYATRKSMNAVDAASPAQFGSKFFQFVTWEMGSGLSQQLHNIPVPASVSRQTDR